MGLGMGIDFENPMGMGVEIGITFENEYGYGYSYTRPTLISIRPSYLNVDSEMLVGKSICKKKNK